MAMIDNVAALHGFIERRLLSDDTRAVFENPAYPRTRLVVKNDGSWIVGVRRGATPHTLFLQGDTLEQLETQLGHLSAARARA